MMDWSEEDKASIWHPFTPLMGDDDPVVITSASGIFLRTEDGRKIIDGISSWWVNLHGHSHPAIAEAIYQQAKTLEHVIFAGFTHPPGITLAKKLLGILPGNQSKIFYSDNGSTAVEVAIKMALQFWFNQGHPKKRIVALEGAYHGDTFGAMSVGDRSIFNAPFYAHLFHVDFIPWPDGTNDELVIERFKSLISTNEIAAFIYEPQVQAAAGMRMYDFKLLDHLLGLADDKNVICIADEVFTGFGRTGRMFASDLLEHKPEIMALSKGLTGGTMALGVTSCSQEVQDAFQSPDLDKTFLHGHSFTANPLACAAASASFDLLIAPECLDRIRNICETHLQFVAALGNPTGVSNIRSLGTILALDVKTQGPPSYKSEIRKRIYTFFLDRGILLRPLGNVIYFLPSYAFTAKEMQVVYNAISEFIDAIRSKSN